LSNIVTDFAMLHEAYLKARRGKGRNITALRYGLDVTRRTIMLGDALDNRTYEVGPYYKFKVYEPKEREVLAIDFAGKVMQHSLCDNVLGPCFTRSFIYDNYASQKGRGTHFGLDRLGKALKNYFFSRKFKEDERRRLAGIPPLPQEEWDYSDGYVLKGDISKFFYTIVHGVLYEKITKRIAYLEDKELAGFTDWLVRQIIDSTPDPGIPIGNQSSQLFALLYLDGLDHLIKDKYGIKIYGRYMDDFYIVHESKAALREILKNIEKHVSDLGLSLNSKTQIFPLGHGIDFLGFRTYLTKTGKVVREVRKKSKNNMRRKIKKFRTIVDRNRVTLDAVMASYVSWCGHIQHGNTYRLRSKMDRYFYSVFPELKSNYIRRK
jgi:hypothetical protein